MINAAFIAALASLVTAIGGVIALFRHSRKNMAAGHDVHGIRPGFKK